jgi:hypothetical protein
MTKKMTVEKVVAEPGRKLLYGAVNTYHLIAGVDDEVQVGDRVVFELCGVNFGWFVEVVKNEDNL